MTENSFIFAYLEYSSSLTAHKDNGTQWIKSTTFQIYNITLITKLIS